MASIEDVVTALQGVAGTLAGVRAAPDLPPEAINQFPFALTYPLRFTARGGPAGLVQLLATLVTEIHCARQHLPRDIATASPYGRLFARAIWADPTIGGTVATVNEIRATFGTLQWGAQPDVHLGWRFEIDIKLEESTT